MPSRGAYKDVVLVNPGKVIYILHAIYRFLAFGLMHAWLSVWIISGSRFHLNAVSVTEDNYLLSHVDLK